MYTLVFAVVAATIPSLVAAAPVTSCTRSYTVVENDTCDSISAANNVSTYQLAQVNVGAVDDACSNLQIDQVLCLGVIDADCTATYTVQENDFCQAVADSQGLDLSTLMANNPNIDSACSNIYPGEVLCVAQQVIASVSSSPPSSGTDGTDGSSDGTDSSSDGTDGSSDGTDGSSDGTDGSSDGSDGSSDGTDNVAPAPAQAAPPQPAATDAPASTDVPPASPTSPTTSTDDPNEEDLPDCPDDEEDDGQQ